MAVFKDTTITDAGKKLLAQALANRKQITFTKLETSDFDYEETNNIEEVINLNQVKQSINLSSVVQKGTFVTVKGVFTNRGLVSSYEIKTIGCFAKINDENEILYSITRVKTPDTMPAENGINLSTIEIELVTQINNESGAVIKYNPDTIVTRNTLASETEAGLVTLAKIKETVRENAPSLESYENVVKTHSKKQIHSEEGVHGLRYYDDELQVKSVAGEWETAGTGGSGNAPSNVVNPKIKVGNQKLSISWGDPGDTIVNGQTISTWRGTKLVQKVGSYPEKVNDGILLLDNQEKDKYKETPFEVNNLVNGQTYYFALFPYGDKKSVNLSNSNRLKGTPQPFKIMTVKIDMSNSNPETCVTYADDAVGMTPGSQEWDEFFGHYPCLLKATEEQGKLKRDNFRQFENGTPADITTGDAGDVMIAFPRKGLRIDTTGDIVTVSMTDDPDNSEFKYYAHSRGEERRDKFYVGAYMGLIKNEKLRSLSDVGFGREDSPLPVRSKAQNNHPNYLVFAFYQLTFIQAMFVLKYKTLTGKNFKQNLKRLNQSQSPTGAINVDGMDVAGIWTYNNEKIILKMFGIEYLFSLWQEWIDGVYAKVNSGTNSFDLLTSKCIYGVGYFDNDKNMLRKGTFVFQRTSGTQYLKRIHATTETGFLPISAGGSETTYFCTDIDNTYGGASFTGKNIFGLNFHDYYNYRDGRNYDSSQHDKLKRYYRLMYL